jgi:BASS family bile acid:Na+ symporter
VDGHATTGTGDRLARFVQKQFLWLLLGCYALATLWPQLGVVLRSWHVRSSLAGDAPVVPLLLLALMLFCAALATDLGQIRLMLQHPLVLFAALAAVWLGPALLVVAAGSIVPRIVDGPAIAGLLVGLALVAAMPVANSSVGWVQNAGGNLALGLALVVLSISLSPWATPQLLALLGRSLSPDEQLQCQRLVTNFSGWFFIVWVVLPTVGGFVCRRLAKAERVASAGGWVALASAAALLALNYINSAPALPRIRESSAALLAVTALLAVALGVVGHALGWALARLFRQPRETRSALMFGLSMKHTGLALILAGQVLADQPLAILIIVLATLAQHLLAGIAQRALYDGA